jgi:hypothetical protein
MNPKLLRYGLIGLLAAGATTAIAAKQYLSASTDSKLSQAAPPASHHEHSMPGMPGMSEESHAEHGADRSTSPEATLTPTDTIALGKPTSLKIDVRSKDGKAIEKFDQFQEKLMHLIVVSSDLQSFEHLHPTYEGNGRFVVNTTFQQPGEYTLFGDYKPAGQPEAVSVFKAAVPGKSAPIASIDNSRSKTVSNTKAALAVSESVIKAGQEVTLTFALKDMNDQPVRDLQPYLGEKGHLVVLRQSESLSRADYIHAHAMKGGAADQVQFMTQFPKPGRYKLWGQFDRNGKIVVAAFWVEVI